MLLGAEHVQRYRETGGREGHDWEGTTTLLLTTTGRKSGQERTTPLIYREVGEGAWAVAASNGGGGEPQWFLNLAEMPEVRVQIRDEEFLVQARVVDAVEKAALWKEFVATWPAYDKYQARASREIPVVLLERKVSELVD